MTKFVNWPQVFLRCMYIHIFFIHIFYEDWYFACTAQSDSVISSISLFLGVVCVSDAWNEDEQVHHLEKYVHTLYKNIMKTMVTEKDLPSF